MKYFSMFSGIGGFEYGISRVCVKEQRKGEGIGGQQTQKSQCSDIGADRFTCVGYSEIDKYAIQIYKKHFKGHKNYGDTTRIIPEEIPDFDLLVGGFPCQSFSIAGKRGGFEDTRGTLFFEICRIARVKRPRLILLENVKGLLSHDKGKTLHTIITTLDEIGYDVQWQVINSKYFVPQNRERIFIVGHLRGTGGQQIFPLGNNDEKTGGENNLKQLNETLHDTGIIYHPDGLARSLRANSGGMGSKTGLYAVVNDHGKLKEKEISSNIDANYWKGMDNHAQRTMVYLSNTNANMKQRTQDRKETWTLGTGTDFGIKDGVKIRRLTPLECERLQGFPDEWTKYDTDGNILSDTQRYKMCGNAVTVSVVQYIGENF